MSFNFGNRARRVKFVMQDPRVRGAARQAVRDTTRAVGSISKLALEVVVAWHASGFDFGGPQGYPAR